ADLRLAPEAQWAQLRIHVEGAPGSLDGSRQRYDRVAGARRRDRRRPAGNRDGPCEADEAEDRLAIEKSAIEKALFQALARLKSTGVVRNCDECHLLVAERPLTIEADLFQRLLQLPDRLAEGCFQLLVASLQKIFGLVLKELQV